MTDTEILAEALDWLADQPAYPGAAGANRAGAKRWQIDHERWVQSGPRHVRALARALAAAGVTAELGVERLGLNPEQTAILRGHIASRQQTVAEFLGDVLMEYGLGRATGKEYPPPARLLEERHD